MTNTIRLKITCFLLLFTVLLIKDILDLAWHLATRMKFGTWEQNWDLYGTISGLWSQLGPSPKVGTSLRALFLLFWFFLFWDQAFRNLNRDFFFETKFSETKTFFRDQIFWNRDCHHIVVVVPVGILWWLERSGWLDLHSGAGSFCPPRPLRGWVTGGLQRCSLLHSITMIAMSINNIIFTLLSSIFNEAESRMGQDQCSRHRHQHNFINIISHRHPYPYISKEATISMRGAEWYIRKTRQGIEFLNSSSIGPKNLVPWKQLWRWIKETNYIFEFKGDCFTFPFRIPWAMVCSNSNKRIVRMPWLTTIAHFSESLKCLILSQVVQAQPLNRKLIAYLCTGTTKSRFSRKRTFF